MAGIPPHKLIKSEGSGPVIIVDGFRHASKAPKGSLFFLSHAHSDHYDGIKSDWGALGPIFCSEVTARLVTHLLGVAPAALRPLPLGRPCALPGGGEVTLVDANHCPGAVILLFRLPDGRRVVHTGDFRASPAMAACPLLAAFRGADELYLDTTYANPRHRFPPQEEAVARAAAAAAAALAEDAAAGRRRLLLVSTYVIGKERLLAAVAAACGVRIYVDERKAGVAAALGLSESNIFTDDPSSTPVHVVRWGNLGETWPFFRPNWIEPAAYARRVLGLPEEGASGGGGGEERGCFVGFVPTGWVHSMGKDPYPVLSKGGNTIHLVPYSEHSSYDELLSFVAALRPARVVPTVVPSGDDGGRAVDRILRRFSTLTDQTAAKARFLAGMSAAAATTDAAVAQEGEEDEGEELKGAGEATSGAVATAGAGAAKEGEEEVVELLDDCEGREKPRGQGGEEEGGSEGTLVALTGGALTAAQARQLLGTAGGDVARAADMYFDGRWKPGSGAAAAAGKSGGKAGGGSGVKRRRSDAGAAPAPGQRSILSFFGGGSAGAGPSGSSPAPRAAASPKPAAAPAAAPAASPSPSKKLKSEYFLSPSATSPAAPAADEGPSTSAPPPVPQPLLPPAPTGPRDAVTLPLAKYHPVAHAPWSPGQPAPYIHLSRAFEACEATTKRLAIADVLTNAFRSLLALGSPEEVASAAYLAVGRIGPDYEPGNELNVGGASVAAAVAEATGVKRARLREMYNAMGDLGDVAAACKRTQTTLAAPAPLTVAGVHAALRGIAGERGAGAARRRQAAVLGLLRSSREAETKYVVRTLVQALRFGANWRSVVPALARAVAVHGAQRDALAAGADALPAQPPKAELDAAAAAATAAFHVCPNLDLLVAGMLEGPLATLEERCRLTPGVPIKPMLARIGEGVGGAVAALRGAPFLAEYKYDGVRAQIHVRQDGEISVFSRNCEDRTAAFPDVVAAVRAAAEGGARSFILDAEVVAVERGEGEALRLRPFQDLAARPRGGGGAPPPPGAPPPSDVCVFAFDLLERDGRSLLGLPLRQRREELAAALPRHTPGVVQLAQGHEVEGAGGGVGGAEGEEVEGEEAEETEENGAPGGEAAARVRGWLLEAVAAGAEGLMLKALDAGYQPSRLSESWVKLKRDYAEDLADSLDVAVIGAWHGSGRKAGWYSPFLLAVYDSDTETFQSVCRCMSGFSDEFYRAATARLAAAVIPTKKPYYDTGETPDVWFEAREVWEVRGADLTLSPVHRASAGRVGGTARGVGLRFPRFLRTREDKAPEDATPAETVAEMYMAQQRRPRAPGEGGAT